MVLVANSQLPFWLRLLLYPKHFDLFYDDCDVVNKLDLGCRLNDWIFYALTRGSQSFFFLAFLTIFKMYQKWQKMVGNSCKHFWIYINLWNELIKVWRCQFTSTKDTNRKIRKTEFICICGSKNGSSSSTVNTGKVWGDMSSAKKGYVHVLLGI